MDKSASFWNRIAERYSKKPVANEAAYQKKLKVTHEYLRPGMELLELGCGTGSTAIIHAPYVKHIRAIDISSKMLEIAERKAKAQNIHNITFECSSINELRVADQSVDVILGLNILHLLENKDEVIGQVFEMLKPGGLFITSTVCIGQSNKLTLFIKLIGPVGRLLGLMPKVCIFTTKDLKNSLSQAGFEIDYIWELEKDLVTFIVAKKTNKHS